MVTLFTFYPCHLLTYQHKIRSPYQFRTNQSQKFQEFCLQFVLIMDPFVVRKPERQIKLSSFHTWASSKSPGEGVQIFFQQGGARGGAFQKLSLEFHRVIQINKNIEK